MKPTRYSTSRQKVCHQCSTAKARCDRKSGRCSRCARRGLSCTYPRISYNGGSTITADDSEFSSSLAPSVSESLPLSPQRDNVGSQILTVESTRPAIQGSPSDLSPTLIRGCNLRDLTLGSQARLFPTPETLDFSTLELFSPIDVNQISNRWLNSYIPIPGQKTKDYPATVSAFIYRILKSYVVVAIRGRGIPPFIHSSQVLESHIKPPLSTCLSLVRICERPLPGSEKTASDVLQKEMSNLYEQHKTYDDVTLLAAFQAYLLYAMALFFKLDQVSGPFLRQAMMNLQELACASSRGGLMCSTEQQRSRPRWESWIVAEAKRRTLYIMYLFDSVLSTRDSLQTFLGTELRGLPASSNKSLWISQIRREWETVYNIDLADWPGGYLSIDELWPIPTDFNESQVIERRKRVDQWLENIDEFGTMLYAVTSCTHGG